MPYLSSIHSMNTANLKHGLFTDVSPLSLIQASIRSNMPDIRLPIVSELILDQASQMFLARVPSDVAGAILLISSWMVAHRFSNGDRLELFPSHSFFSQNAVNKARLQSSTVQLRIAVANSSLLNFCNSVNFGWRCGLMGTVDLEIG